MLTFRSICIISFMIWQENWDNIEFFFIPYCIFLLVCVVRNRQYKVFKLNSELNRRNVNEGEIRSSIWVSKFMCLSIDYLFEKEIRMELVRRKKNLPHYWNRHMMSSQWISRYQINRMMLEKKNKKVGENVFGGKYSILL